MKRYWWIPVVLILAAGAAFLLLSPQPAVLTAGDFRLDNTGFGYYYWSEFFYFSDAYGDYLGSAVDLSKPLDQQTYGPGTTWQDYLIEEALSVAADTMTMVFAAEEAGFVLPADYEAALENTWSGFVLQSGGDLEAYLKDSYGKKATADSFRTYLFHAHMASAYADQLYESLNPSAEDIADYRDDHAGEYLDQGLAQEDWDARAREDLIAQLHAEQVRQLRAKYDFQVNYQAVDIVPPKGLYE